MKVFKEKELSIGWIVSKIRPPRLSATFFVKAVFSIALDKKASLTGGIPLCGDVYSDDEPNKSLVYESDFAPFKPRADVLLVGMVHAPRGKSVPFLEVRFRVGALSKTLNVTGQRGWEQKLLGRLIVSDPEPFTQMPIVYERAFGGPGYKKNPVGRGYDSHQAPNVEDPGRFAKGPRDNAEPAGYGPLGASWEQRACLVGTYDKSWLRERWPWFPEDFDWAYFNAAPRDQQVEGYLRGDEELEFDNLHPEHSVYRSTLPGLRARCFVNERLQHGELHFREVPLNLDTLWINVEEEKLILVWRGVADVRTMKLKEIEDIVAVTEPLSEPPKNLDHYRKTLLGPAAPTQGAAEEAAARWEAEFQARFADMEKRFAEADNEFVQADQLVQRYEAEAAEALADQKAALIASGVDPKLLEGGAGPRILAEAGAALAASLAQLKASDPQAAAQLDQIDPSVFQQIEKETEDLEREVEDLRKEMKALKPPVMTRDSVQAALAAGQVLEKQDLSEVDLAGMDLSNANLAGAVFRKANLKGAKLAKANLSKADLTGADLSNADLTGAVLDEADLTGAVFANTKVSGLSLAHATLSGLDLKGADFSRSTGKGANFSKSNLVGARFTRAKLPQASFSDCALEKADFRGAELQGAGFESVKAAEINMEGAQIVGLRAGPKSVFTKGNFKKVNGTRSVWEGSMLDGADFSRALLSRAQFSDASLRNALFDRADLSHAAFDDACLRGAILTNANVLRATFDRADLAEAKVSNSNFFEAGFWETVTVKTDFQKANVKSTLLS